MHGERKDQVESLLHQSVSKINISCDLWTGDNRRNYLGVVAHWIAPDGDLNTALIALSRLFNAHSGANQAVKIFEALERYSITDNTGCFMMDNAHDNDKLMDNLAQKLPDFDSKTRRLRCAGQPRLPSRETSVERFVFRGSHGRRTLPRTARDTAARTPHARRREAACARCNCPCCPDVT